ncbi:MAG: hypothetical protein EBV03_10700 [Proteobacteria bacterium]|nr:hypothetical protein [Pseudomonadota bacterium]
MSDTTSITNTQPEAGASLDAQGVAALLIGRDSQEPDSGDQQKADQAVGSPSFPTQPSQSSSGDGKADATPQTGIEAISIPVPGQHSGDDDPDNEEEEEQEGDPAEGKDAEGDHEQSQWPESAKKRIAKLTAQKHGLLSEKEQLTTKVQQLEQQLAERPQGAAPAPAETPLADVQTFEELEDLRQSGLRALDWCLANPYGGEVPDGKGGTVTLSGQDVQERKAAIERTIQVQIPQREQWLADNAQVNQQLEAIYPDLFRPGPASTAAHHVLQELPELGRRPDYVAIVGDILVGRAVRSGQAVLVPKGTPKPKPAGGAVPPAVPPRTTPAAPPAGRGADAAKNQFLRTGEPTDLASAIEQRL